MNRILSISSLPAVFFVALPTLLSALPVEIDLTPYATRHINTMLVPGFPTGEVVPPLNNFGVPFRIPAEGNNFFTVEQSETPLTVPVGVFGCHKIYTLIQAYGPRAGDPILTVDFNGSAGAHQKFTLLVGRDVRDFFESGFCREINNTTTRTAFEFIGRGGAYTDDVTTGPRGFYDFDEQEFTLDPAFATQTLESITLTRHLVYGTPMILGLTVVTAAAPVPAFYQTLRFWLWASAGLAIVGAVGLTLWIRHWLNSP